jgi:glutathione peroxidase
MTQPIRSIPINRIDGTPTTLAEHQGKVLLIVNVASKCGFTPQYESLESLHETQSNQGLVICGFPANDFSEQEPGSDLEIQSFCTTSFGVRFPMYAKIAVTGPERHPLYTALIEAAPAITGDTADLRQHLVEFGATPTAPPEVLWNFEKFLVSRDGKVVARFSPDIPPDDPGLTQAIAAELAR